MENKSRFIFVFIGFVLMFVIGPVTRNAHGAVIFEDNFDSQINWQPRPATNDASPSGAVAACDFTETSCAYPVPSGWSYFRSTGLWWGPTYQDTLRITNLAGRGGTGKAFIVYNESNNGASGDGWGADGILAKLFSQDSPELYTRYYIRTQSAWTWEQNQRIQIKHYRTGHFNRSGGGSFFQLGSTGDKAPLMIYDFMNSSNATGQLYGSEQSSSLRCFPPSTDYMCPNSPTSDFPSSLYFKTDAPGGTKFPASNDPHTTGLWADGNWHRFDTHLKMNTYAGGGVWNSDGVYELWYDGVLQRSVSTIKWINSGTDSTIGWNTFELGGNAYNNYSAPVNKAEQWYAIDDVVVSTTPIPGNYVIGGLKAPKNLSGTPVKP